MKKTNLELIKTSEKEKSLQEPLLITLDQYLIKKGHRLDHLPGMRRFGSKAIPSQSGSYEEWEEIFKKY